MTIHQIYINDAKEAEFLFRFQIALLLSIYENCGDALAANLQRDPAINIEAINLAIVTLIETLDKIYLIETLDKIYQEMDE